MGDALTRIVAVGAGGCLGAIARDLLSSWLRGQAAVFQPIGTLAVNVAGCLGIGALMAFLDSGREVTPQARLFLATGLLGGFTTFSAFGAETIELAGTGPARSALTGAGINVALNVGLGLLAVVAGRAAVRSLLA